MCISRTTSGIEASASAGGRITTSTPSPSTFSSESVTRAATSTSASSVSESPVISQSIHTMRSFMSFTLRRHPSAAAALSRDPRRPGVRFRLSRLRRLPGGARAGARRGVPYVTRTRTEPVAGRPCSWPPLTAGTTGVTRFARPAGSSSYPPHRGVRPAAVAAVGAADAVGGPVGGRRGAQLPPEVAAQRHRRAEAAAPRDLVHRVVGGLQQPLRLKHPLGDQPLQRRAARERAEPPVEGPARHVRACGQRLHVELLVQVLQRPRHDLGERVRADLLG